MPKSKYNWPQLKAEYIASDFIEVKAFMIAKFGVYNNTMNKSTRGWPDVKKKHDEEKNRRLIEEFDKKYQKEGMIMLDNLMTGFKRHLKTVQDLDKIPIRDKKRVWEVVMTMIGKPTRIIQNRNFNSDVEDPEDTLDKLQDDGNPESPATK